MTLVIRSVDEARRFVSERRSQGKTVGLVPTMGYLHRGHMSLVERSLDENDVTVVSLFVNPIQFGPGEDLDRYPRDEDRDLSLLQDAGVDVLFAPEADEMYHPSHSTYVDEAAISFPLCGGSRPGHFRGVCTVVLKLFNVLLPDRAYFGMKDYQQLQVINRMVRDLNVPVEVRPCPIVREADGLALSSRNVYLSEDERRSALFLSKSLSAAKDAFDGGERSAFALADLVWSVLAEGEGLVPEYVEVRDAHDLSEVADITGPVVVALAVRAGSTRLIDNVVLGE